MLMTVIYSKGRGMLHRHSPSLLAFSIEADGRQLESRWWLSSKGRLRECRRQGGARVGRTTLAVQRVTSGQRLEHLDAAHELLRECTHLGLEISSQQLHLRRRMCVHAYVCSAATSESSQALESHLT